MATPRFERGLSGRAKLHHFSTRRPNDVWTASRKAKPRSGVSFSDGSAAQSADGSQIISAHWPALLSGSRVNDRGDFGDPVYREACLLGMIPYYIFVLRDVNAVDLVASNVTLEPLNL